jgi:hypothetical protein
MRSGQHNNKRSRGRSRSRHSGGGSSSGGGNPINRVYESNGPEVKVRGTAQTVADKYLQLGRDAQASGDNVMAENFYQHAEHYLRILAAAQAYNQQYQQQQFRRPPGDEMFDEDEGDDAGEGDGGDSQPPFADRPQYGQDQHPPQPQPTVVDAAEQPASEIPDSQPPQQQSRPPRDYGRDRGRYRGSDNRRDGDDRNRQPQPQPRNEPAPPVAEVQAPEASQPAAPSGESWDGPQPSFLKRPTNGSGNSRSRKPRREAGSTEGPEAASSEDAPAK